LHDRNLLQHLSHFKQHTPNGPGTLQVTIQITSSDVVKFAGWDPLCVRVGNKADSSVSNSPD
jgi:hypothetical protein